jgi:hypothetical protein
MERPRRVVTRLNKAEDATIMFDGPADTLPSHSGEPVGYSLWCTDEMPADLSLSIDRGKLNKLGFTPRPKGSVFRIVDFPPGGDASHLPLNHTARMVASDETPRRGLPPSHPWMHRTRTLDYGVVIAGEIDMLLDKCEVQLRAGDVFVQQGTNHAWVNRSSSVCRIAFILLDALDQ